MNRMDCFKKQPSEFHYGTTHMPVPSTYNSTHEKVLAALNREWSSSGDVWRRIPQQLRPCGPTVRRHLMDLEKEGKAESRLEYGTWEWRRV